MFEKRLEDEILEVIDHLKGVLGFAYKLKESIKNLFQYKS